MAIRKICALALGLALSAGTLANADAQTIGYNTRTGDVWVDNRLGEINDYGRQYRDPFIGEMTGHYGAPQDLVVELLDQRRWSPGDVYYACAMASVLGLPCVHVVREYDRDPGQGWGNVAKRMGIKPGSAQFHALKRGAVDTYDRWGYPITVDNDVRVDWAQHGPGKGGGKAAGNWKGSPSSHGKDNPGKSNPGKGKPDKDNPGKGNPGKGQGKP